MHATPSTRKSSSALRVRDIMSENPLTAKASDDVRLASQMMLWGAFHHLPVVEGEALIGIVTERELSRVRASLDQGSRIAVGEVMVTDVLTTEPDALVADAADRMADAYVGCLPVLEGEKLIGILTTTDVLTSTARPRLVKATASRVLVRDVMNPSPLTVRSNTVLTDALAVMVEHNVRHLPVVDDETRLIGMLSDRDVRTAVGDPLAALYEDDFGPAAAVTVEDVMSELPVISVRADEPIEVLTWGFVDRRVGAVPVVDQEQRVIGIVSYVDVLHRSLKAGLR